MPIPVQGLPALRPFDISPAIASFDSGVNTGSRLAEMAARKEARGRETAGYNAMQEAGNLLASGDRAGAESALLRAGRINEATAVREQGYKEDERTRARKMEMTDKLLGAVYGVDDPQQYNQILTGFAQEYGMDPQKVLAENPFEQREANIRELAGAKWIMEQEAKRNLAQSRGGGGSYGKTGAVFKGDDGQYYTVQFGSDGTRKIEPVSTPGEDGVPLTPDRGVSIVGDEAVDRTTAQPVRNVGDALARGKEAETIGKGRGEAQLALPKAQLALEQYDLKNRYVAEDIDLALSQASWWTTGFAGDVSKALSGSPAHDLSKTLEGIKANLGFETLQQMRDSSPTGGALGQVTERELELLQSTWGSVMQSQSEGQFRRNLSRLKEIKAQFADLKREAYERDVARFGAGAVPNPGGPAATSSTSTGSGPVRVNSIEEAQRLPSGTIFLDPNGVQRRVP